MSSEFPGMQQVAQFPANSDKSLIELYYEDPVYLIRMNAGENRFDLDFISAFNSTLDLVEDALKSSSPRPAALITTGKDKFYSNGLDLAFLMNYAESSTFLRDHYLKLISRVLTFPCATIACINGHAFAGGCILALAHDYRVMRSERGFICMNEISLPSHIPGGMLAVMKAKIKDHMILRDATLKARRFPAEEAKAFGFVDIVASTQTCIAEAIKLAKEHADSGRVAKVYELVKKELYCDAVQLLASQGPVNLFEHINKAKI